MALLLKENLTFDNAQMKVLSEDSSDGKSKDLYMEGIFIQGGVKNANKREIGRAVV